MSKPAPVTAMPSGTAMRKASVILQPKRPPFLILNPSILSLPRASWTTEMKKGPAKAGPISISQERLFGGGRLRQKLRLAR